MINETETKLKFGYTSNDIGHFSKHILIYSCDVCHSILEKESIKIFMARKNSKSEIDVCSNIECIKKKRENTMLKEYGVVNAGLSSEIRNRVENTCLERYGTKHPMKNIELQKQSKIGCLKKYGVENPFQSNIIKNKIKSNNIEKYGVDSYAKTDKFKTDMMNNYGYISAFELKETHDKSKLTLLKKYNCDHNFKITEVKEKRKKTFLKKYGFDNATKSEIIKDKTKKTNNEKYGGNSPMNNQEVKNKSNSTYKYNYAKDSDNLTNLILKREKTMLENYGVKYWAQNSENIYKYNQKTKYKKYFFNNEEIYLQGYEDYVLFELLIKKYDINDICINNKNIENYTTKIYYNYKEREHKYYPDFYIISENKIIEVKSNYTYDCQLDINLIKKEECLKRGFEFEFIIIDNKEYKKWKNKNKNKNGKI